MNREDLKSLKHANKLDLVNNITNVDIVKSREEKFLSLRKKQINNFIFSKRFLSDPDENLKIDPKQLNLLPENLIDFDLELIKNLINSEEISLIKYGLYLSRSAIINEDNYKKNCCLIKGNFSFMSKIFQYLNFPDVQIQYESSWFLINYFAYEDEMLYLENIFSNKENRNNFIEFFKNSENVNFFHAVWIMGNLATTFHFIRKIFYEEHLYEKIIYLVNLQVSDKVQNQRICWLLANITKGSLKIQSMIPSIMKLWKIIYDDYDQYKEAILFNQNISKINNVNYNQKNLTEILFCLFNLSSISSNTLDKLLNYNLHVDLASILTIENNNVNGLIWKIFGEICSSSDYHTQILLNIGLCELISNYFDKEFEQYDLVILKNILWLCSNIACGSISQIKTLIDSNLIKKIILISDHLRNTYQEKKENFNENYSNFCKCYRESLYVILDSIVGSLELHKISIIDSTDIDIPHLIIDGINTFYQDERFIVKSFSAIKYLIQLDEIEMDIELVDKNPRFLKKKFIKYGIEDILNAFNIPNQNYELIKVIDDLMLEFEIENNLELTHYISNY